MLLNNPYKNALEGLVIDDPVRSFFDWCKEREQIRIRRQNGQPFPWTEDAIFQRGRFLNTFREDDKGSLAIRRFCKPVENSLPDLIHALFFARWCNHHKTLDTINVRDITDPEKLSHLLQNTIKYPWFSEVYPVESVHWEGKKYDRFSACTELFPRIRNFLEDCIKKSEGKVTLATSYINKVFQMSNDFPIFMAVIDISWFQPAVIHPESPVPTGIGAAPYLDILQKFLKQTNHRTTIQHMIKLQKEYWPEARRDFTPVDIEYISCECRKYFSYINGTKNFEGKNLFIPAEHE